MFEGTWLLDLIMAIWLILLAISAAAIGFLLINILELIGEGLENVWRWLK